MDFWSLAVLRMRFLRGNEAFAKPFFMLVRSVNFYYHSENVSPIHVSIWFNFNDLVEGFLAFAKPGGLGEVQLVDLASLSIILLRFFIEMATISKWCLVHL